MTPKRLSFNLFAKKLEIRQTRLKIFINADEMKKFSGISRNLTFIFVEKFCLSVLRKKIPNVIYSLPL